MSPQDAFLIRLQLHIGVVTVPDVVKWADKQIEQMNELAEPLIDLSLSGNKKAVELSSILGDLTAGENQTESSAAAFRRFALARFAQISEGEIKADDLARELY